MTTCIFHLLCRIHKFTHAYVCTLQLYMVMLHECIAAWTLTCVRWDLCICEKRTVSFFCASCHGNACRGCPRIHRDAPITNSPKVLRIAKLMQINNYANLIFCRVLLDFWECKHEVVSMIYAYPSATVPLGSLPKLFVVKTMRQGESCQWRSRIHF